LIAGNEQGRVLRAGAVCHARHDGDDLGEHFVTLYVGLELLSLSLYAMVAMNRDSLASTEAAMKYFVLGALASGMLLYGMSMIYGATGTLEITEWPKCCTTAKATTRC
jgi:NADH:ubiquinone oxidoreductase subunit 2 (subunit N)